MRWTGRRDWRSLESEVVVSPSGLRLLGIALFLAGACSSGAFAQAAPGADGARNLSLENVPWTGDLDGMLKQGMIRILVPYSRTLFFNDRGQERGITADVARELERYHRVARAIGRVLAPA